ncbi:hypothetical protein H072_5045 [Dactylellina haptotyla CBS 200.50]|uniref:Myb-like DNA-binding domain-containing protein n=1 Tax=Dactylellina haptotyla (strain CBS 200.50) TaxID=1284197 RepID=S8C0D9_DACHA|nr:hypothetical protein H072_5045 [Dactylellina haptotyla CBS 200.50]
MAPKNTSSDDQFMFLISCMKYANNGKPDFELVAQERGIVSKGAAAKRFSRMMKAHGISLATGNLSQTSPRKGVDSPPVSDEEKNDDQENENQEEQEISTSSKKRKRDGCQQQTPSRGSMKRVRILEPKEEESTQPDEDCEGDAGQE